MTTNTRAYSRAHYAANRERYAEAKRRYRACHPERVEPQNRAWALKHPEEHALVHRVQARVYYAIKTGRLVRPDQCERCGAGGQIEAAHWDYSRPLDVLWLCVPCHRQWDAPRFEED